jgi:hypothetical protein
MQLMLVVTKKNVIGKLPVIYRQGNFAKITDNFVTLLTNRKIIFLLIDRWQAGTNRATCLGMKLEWFSCTNAQILVNKPVHGLITRTVIIAEKTSRRKQSHGLQEFH